MMKKTTFMTLALALALAVAPALSDAKRLGGGRSSGMQRNMPARTAPDAPPAKPAAPQQQPQQAGTPAAANAAATPPKRSWMGPLAGLAAGLGIGALLSHFGMGGALASGIGSMLMIALLAVAGFALYRLLTRRNGPKPAFAGAMGGIGGSGNSGNSANSARVAWPQAATPLPAATPAATANPAVAATTPGTTAIQRAFVPASFDSDGFGRTAKALFIRLQAANDSGDVDDLRRFTTPEMFAELKLDLQDRAGSAQTTDVVKVDADVLDIEDDGQRQVVSVRFHGQVREEAGGAPVPFDEVWHLAKPHDDSRPWAIAGIEQLPAKA